MKPTRPSRKNFTFDDDAFRDEPTAPIRMPQYQAPQPAYKNPYAPIDHQRADADRDIGNDKAAFNSLRKGAVMKKNSFRDTLNNTNANGHTMDIDALLDPSFDSDFPGNKNEHSGGGGFQMPLGAQDKLKEVIRSLFHEVVRKKPGGGGYVLYSPNKGKKKSAKPVGEFPTRLAARRAELARFPPKDGEELKKKRKRMDKLTKDPKKRADAERRDMLGKSAASKPKRKGTPKKAPVKKPARESVWDAMTNAADRALREALFRTEDVAGSPWDERLSSVHPDAISSDKRLVRLHRNIEKGSRDALNHAARALGKALKGVAKVQQGQMESDEARQKRFAPMDLDCDGIKIGPVHLYVDGGHVKMEMSEEANEAMKSLDPNDARKLRGYLVSFQDEDLPRIDVAKKAYNDRDRYLDKLHNGVDAHLGSLSPMELHLVRRLLNTKHRGRR